VSLQQRKKFCEAATTKGGRKQHFEDKQA